MTILQELRNQNEFLRIENQILKKVRTSFFEHVEEKTVAAQALRDNKIPYFVYNKMFSTHKQTNEPVVTLIEGDNLPVLTALQYSHKKQVDVIYIDPPYNTGKKVYTYKDNYSNQVLKKMKKDSPQLDNHSIWLSFMEIRLMLAKKLLQPTGVIMVAISSTEYAHLKLLMDQIFGEQNFIANITWSGGAKNNSHYVSVSSDYMLIYAKNVKHLNDFKIKWRASKPSAQTLLRIASGIWQENPQAELATKKLRKFLRTSEAQEMLKTEPGLKMYNSIDTQGYLYRAGDLSSPSGKGGQYQVVNPETNEIVTIPSRGWAYSEETFLKKVTNNEILWKGTNIPAYKRYLSKSTSIVLKDIILQDRDASNHMLQKMIGRGKFSYPKDIHVLAEWINYVIPDFRKTDIKHPPLVLDFFAGSGSTGHAVAYLNAQDLGQRECILVTNNENNIAEKVTFPRMKAALTGEWVEGPHEMLPGELVYYKTYMSTGKQPKIVWDFIPYSKQYLKTVNNVIKEMKMNGFL